MWQNIKTSSEVSFVLWPEFLQFKYVNGSMVASVGLGQLEGKLRLLLRGRMVFGGA